MRRVARPPEHDGRDPPQVEDIHEKMIAFSKEVPGDLAGIRCRLDMAVDLIGREEPSLIARLLLRAMDGIDHIKGGKRPQ